ncbi:MAG: hypothetical protein PVI59_06600 [Anaerolineae bacterium]|jgi:hypothetical protein
MKYEIRVQGVLDAAWSDVFAGMTLSFEELDAHVPVTKLTGTVEDQAVLRGLLNQLWDLNLTLIAVTCLEE